MDFLKGPLNLLSKPNLTNHLSDTVEVGFGRYGGSIGLAGALSTTNHYIFIQKIFIELLSLKNKILEHLDWFAFRPYEFTYKRITETDFQMPAKFMVTPGQAYKYNILFVNEYKYSEIKPFVKAVRQQWSLWIQHSSPEDLNKPEENFQRFLLDQETLKTIEQLIRLSAWLAGGYSITLKVLTEHPVRSLEIRKNFQLTDTDVDILQNNATMIVRDICNQSGSLYQTLSLKLS